MPVVNSSGAIAIYATVDKSKKKNKVPQTTNSEDGNVSESSVLESKASDVTSSEVDTPTVCNYVNVEAALDKHKVQSSTVDTTSTTTIHDTSITTESLNYMNLDFAHSLEYYENSRDLLAKAGLSQQDIDKIAHDIATTPNEKSTLPYSFDKNGVKYCTKCGHACSSNEGSGPAPPQDATQKSEAKQDDYLMMEPGITHRSQGNSVQDLLNRSLPGGKIFPGYLPMSPISNMSCLNKPDLLKLSMSKGAGLLAEKAASIPSLSGPIVDRSRKRSDSDFQRVPGAAMLGMNHSVSAAPSPYLRRHVMGCLNDESRISNSLMRKRSSSADSTRYLDDLESITERTISSSPTQVNNSGSSKNTSLDSLSSQTLSLKRPVNVPSSTADSLTSIPPCVNRTASQDGNTLQTVQNTNQNEKVLEGSLRTLIQECLDQQVSSASVHIRRSSSVPCKSGNNRDSSSSNDSGVSTGSLKHRGADFAEFELPLTTSMSTRRHHHAVSQMNSSNHSDCLHASLPRRSKSSDPLRELTFQFQKIKIPAKSSSAEAEVPICPVKRDSSKGKFIKG